MRNRQQRLAIIAGLFLLTGEAATRGIASAAIATSLPAVSSGSVAPQELLRTRLASILHAENRRLDTAHSARIAEGVLRCARDPVLSADLVLAVLLVESDARPAVRSPKGAIGLMQVMPHMFAALELPGNAANLEANIEAGCLLLADNIRRLGEADGVSAYFWGSQIGGDGYLRRVKMVRDRLGLQADKEIWQGRG